MHDLRPTELTVGDVRAEAIEAAAAAAVQALELCQSIRALNKAGVVSAIPPCIAAAASRCADALAQLHIIGETIQP